MSIADLTETLTAEINPAHHVMDTAKLAALTASMEANGWVGAPVLADGDQALTGSHRIAAARATDTEVPRVQVAELAAEHGIDWDEIKADNGDDWYRAGIELADMLPAEVVAELGMDLH